MDIRRLCSESHHSAVGGVIVHTTIYSFLQLEDGMLNSISISKPNVTPYDAVLAQGPDLDTESSFD